MCPFKIKTVKKKTKKFKINQHCGKSLTFVVSQVLKPINIRPETKKSVRNMTGWQ